MWNETHTPPKDKLSGVSCILSKCEMKLTHRRRTSCLVSPVFCQNVKWNSHTAEGQVVWCLLYFVKMWNETHTPPKDKLSGVSCILSKCEMKLTHCQRTSCLVSPVFCQNVKWNSHTAEGQVVWCLLYFVKMWNETHTLPKDKLSGVSCILSKCEMKLTHRRRTSCLVSPVFCLNDDHMHLAETFISSTNGNIRFSFYFRLFEMGFSDQLQEIIRRLPDSR